MTCSTLSPGKVAAALARQFAGSSIAIGVANPHSHESIEVMAKQLGAQIAAMSLQHAPTTEVMILAVPIRARAAIGDQPSDWDRRVVVDAIDDGISPDELMGLLNAAR
ncbi:NADP oxidoreductase [Paraburkholderia sp. UYCP14C]|uniref:NAD(P)-binding domain-containing protein n=1 Tax=Paraburkholderia sp. UYCP14C TaxID=2511130 RepID=UPI001021F80A|nr:NAD(P)-binding domain-containing protein [Paraburkholderia sp. UYCP14C]RZF28563.1 NADP oxidoreductase [Paraburkholderia sp. UYCP14C]